MKWTSVGFTCSDDYDPSRQPRPLLQSSGVYYLLIKREVEHIGYKEIGESAVEVESFANKFSPHGSQQYQRVESYVIDRRCRTSYRLHRIYKTANVSVLVKQGQQLQAVEPDQGV